MFTESVWVLLVDGVISVHVSEERAYDYLRANNPELNSDWSDEDVAEHYRAFTSFKLEEHDVLL